MVAVLGGGVEMAFTEGAKRREKFRMVIYQFRWWVASMVVASLGDGVEMVFMEGAKRREMGAASPVAGDGGWRCRQEKEGVNGVVGIVVLVKTKNPIGVGIGLLDHLLQLSIHQGLAHLGHGSCQCDVVVAIS